MSNIGGHHTALPPPFLRFFSTPVTGPPVFLSLQLVIKLENIYDQTIIVYFAWRIESK